MFRSVLLCDCCKTLQPTCLKNRDANGQSLCDPCLRALRGGYRPAKWRPLKELMRDLDLDSR